MIIKHKNEFLFLNHNVACFTKQVLQCDVIKLSLLSYGFGPPALTTWLLCLGISLLWAVGVQFMLSFLDNELTLSHFHL